MGGLSWLALALVLSPTLAHAQAQGQAEAQQPFPQADPQDLGLTLPEGVEALPGGDRLVLVSDAAGELVVAKVHVEVGDQLVLMLPNGRLTSVAREMATPTDRPFVPATKDEMVAELMSKFAGFNERDTNHYVYIYNTSDAFYKGASRILETMYPSLLKFCQREKLAVHKPATPLVVIMFRTQDEFDAYRKVPEGVVAYYNVVNNHVVMYEQSRLTEIVPELALKQSISTIAHEGVHQVLHNIGVQQRLSRWPMWISEGLPEFFAPTEVGQRSRWKGVGKPNDLRMYSLQELLAAQSVAKGDLVKATVEAESLNANGYAVAWAPCSEDVPCIPPFD